MGLVESFAEPGEPRPPASRFSLGMFATRLQRHARDRSMSPSAHRWSASRRKAYRCRGSSRSCSPIGARASMAWTMARCAARRRACSPPGRPTGRARYSARVGWKRPACSPGPASRRSSEAAQAGEDGADALHILRPAQLLARAGEETERQDRARARDGQRAEDRAELLFQASAAPAWSSNFA